MLREEAAASSLFLFNRTTGDFHVMEPFSSLRSIRYLKQCCQKLCTKLNIAKLTPIFSAGISYQELMVPQRFLVLDCKRNLLTSSDDGFRF